MADQKLLKKDLDYYLTDRSRRYPKPAFVQKKPEPPQLKPQREKEDIFEEEEPNFFQVLRDKITGAFKKNK